MAKSTRSKWKRMHRRERAKEEVTNVTKRLTKLNKKLKITVKGGISAIPSEEPERRFHFVNPELDPRVPNTRKNLNNNYRLELNHTTYDFTKPLKLAAPKTNLHGKSDHNAPHPMTVSYETVDADAPVAGHAMTKADLEQAVKKSMAAEAAAASITANEEDDDENNSISNDNDDDGPEEYVFGMEDTAPRKASKSAGKKGAKKSSSSSSGGDAPAVTKIKSMSGGMQKNNKVVAVAGSSKMKKIGSERGAASTSKRIVSSGSKASKKK